MRMERSLLKVIVVSDIHYEKRVFHGIDEFLKDAKELEGKDIDVLLIHETPYLPELFPFMKENICSKTALKL